MEKIKANFRKMFSGSRKVKSIVTAVAITALMSIPAFAVDTTAADLTTTLQTSLTACASNIMSALAVVLPIGLGIVAAMFGVKYGIKFFKSISKG